MSTPSLIEDFAEPPKAVNEMPPKVIDEMPLWEYTARQWLKWGVGAWVIGPLLAKLDATPDRCPHCTEYIR